MGTTTIYYRGWEITPDLTGRGLFACQPEFDLGMPCLWEGTAEGCKRAIDEWIEDNEPDDPVK